MRTIDVPFLCTDCGTGEPTDGNLDGWHTVIMSNGDSTNAVVFCPKCAAIHYGLRRDEQPLGTLH